MNSFTDQKFLSFIHYGNSKKDVNPHLKPVESVCVGVRKLPGSFSVLLYV